MKDSSEHYSNLQEQMQKIYDLHWESGNEAHSKVASDLKKMLELSLKSQKTNYTIKTDKHGKRKIVKSGIHNMGDRFDRKTGEKLDINMGNFIQFRTYSTTGTTVVGGLMKSGRTEIRKDGKVVSTTPVFSVNQSSVDILEKISSGIVGAALWNVRNKKIYSPISMKVFAGTHKPTNFISTGKNAALATASVRIEKEYASALKRRDNVKDKQMKRVD